MSGNKKSFNLITKSSQTFNLILSKFDYAVTFLFRIRNKIKIIFVMSLVNKFIQTINLKRIKILISPVKLIGNQIQTIKLKKIRIGFFAREIKNFIISFTQHVDIVFISKARQKLVSNIVLKKINLSFTAILATFFTLGEHDISTLLVLDSQTLGDLDYIES